MRPLAAMAALAALGGCASNIEGPLAPSFGEAVAAMDRQIIDPTPAEGAPVSSGARAAAAVRRYEGGRVTQPVSTYTEQVMSGAARDGQDDSAASAEK